MTNPSVKIDNETLVAHTPGPWAVESDGHYPIVRKRFRPDHHMDVCGPVYGYIYAEDGKGEQAANARLIAAAPEMYEALQALDRFLDFSEPVTDKKPMIAEDWTALNEAFEQARAALAKAAQS